MSDEYRPDQPPAVLPVRRPRQELDLPAFPPSVRRGERVGWVVFKVAVLVVLGWGFLLLLGLLLVSAVSHRTSPDPAKGQWDDPEWVADLDEAIRRDPFDPALLNSRGLAHYERKEYDAAIADFTRSIQLAPNDPQVYADRGLTCFAREEYDKAVEDYTRAIQLNPGYDLAYIYRADAYRKLGKVELAQADEQKAGDIQAAEKQ
jgi:tetratricopeptide (TPR) repeat protein